MRAASIGSYIWMLAHQRMILLQRGCVTLLNKVVLGWALRFQKPKLNPVLLSPSDVQLSAPCLPARHRHASCHESNGLNLSTVSQPWLNTLFSKSCLGHSNRTLTKKSWNYQYTRSIINFHVLWKVSNSVSCIFETGQHSAMLAITLPLHVNTIDAAVYKMRWD